MTLNVTHHAKERAKERFNIAWENADKWYRDKWAKAKFVSHIVSDRGEQQRMYVSAGVILVVDNTRDIIVTAYPRKANEILADHVRKAAFGYLETARKRSQRDSRKLTVTQAEIEAELSERRLQLLRARKTERKLALQARINALESRLAEVPTEVIAAKRSVNAVVKAVAAYV